MATKEWEANDEQHRFDDEAHAEESDARHEADGPEERAAVALCDAFRVAFHSGDYELDDSVLRTIGNSYASVCFAYGPEQHPRSIVELRKAMDRYAIVCPETESLLFPEGCPF